ncbi:hypothetical protein D9611_009567 [Ephemerocybe angulata]|uniref:Uncharacterized protein n=1 Tax=Ephemerocybe angulata TaxID=980116 RepID=A0A8H5C5K8_9AGAR|nr:hypothetical protein D9611_009567 [Tulosesus angulatus]
MSFAAVSGLFSLSDGARTAGPARVKSDTYDPKNPPRPYITYTTALKTSNAKFPDFPATIRVFSPPQNPVLPNNTVILATAKFYIASNNDGISYAYLEATDCGAFPGDSMSEDYDSSFPDSMYPSVYIMGHCVKEGVSVEEGSVFNASFEQFVLHGMREFNIECLFDKGPRWAKTPPPTPGSCFGAIGVCELYTPSGALRVSLKHIALNGRSKDVSAPATTIATPNRKFAAVLPLPPTTSPAASGSKRPAPIPPLPSRAPATPSPTKKAKTTPKKKAKEATAPTRASNRAKGKQAETVTPTNEDDGQEFEEMYDEEGRVDDVVAE